MIICTCVPSPIIIIYRYLFNFYLSYLVERINEELSQLKKDIKKLQDYQRKEEMKMEERGRERKRRREVIDALDERERDKVKRW